MAGEAYFDLYVNGTSKSISLDYSIMNYYYRPVVYLKSDVIITNDDTGEEGNKYEIGLSE